MMDFEELIEMQEGSEGNIQEQEQCSSQDQITEILDVEETTVTVRDVNFSNYYELKELENNQKFY